MTKLFAAPAVKQNTGTHSGTSAFVLAAAIVPGFLRIVDAMANNDNFIYYAKSADFDEWEVGLGTFDSTFSEVSRGSFIYAGTNGNSRVAFTSSMVEISVVQNPFIQNFILTGGQFAAITQADLPDVSSSSVIAAGKRAVAGDQGIVIGEDALCGTDGVALGIGAQAPGLDSIVVGENCYSNFPYGLAAGSRAAVYANGLHTFSSGGFVSSDVSRQYAQTTNATPTLVTMDYVGNPAFQYLTPNQDGLDKSVSFEVHLLARNATDNDAWYEKFNLVGLWNNTNFVQVGTTMATEIAKGASFTTAVATCTVVNDRLELNVTGVAAKTIQWAATIYSTALWHAGVPGSGV